MVRLGAHEGELVGRHVAQRGRGGVPGRGDDDEVAKPLEQVLHEPAGLVPGGDDPVDHAERATAVVRGDGADDVVEQGGVGVAEQGHRALVVDPGLVRAGHELVEHRQRVAHRPGAGPHHERQHSGADVGALGGAQLLEVAGEDVRRHEPERVVVRARADRPDHLVGLRRGEDEHHMLGRLLDDLEQRVETLRRDHVGLVEDEDLEPVARRGERRPLAQVPRVVDPPVAGGVDLDDVERPRTAARELAARLAHAARHIRRALDAVQAAGQDPGRRRLAAAPRAAEQIGMVDAAGAQRLHERLSDVLLPDHLGEIFGPVAAVQGCRHPTDSRRRTRARSHSARHRQRIAQQMVFSISSTRKELEHIVNRPVATQHHALVLRVMPGARSALLCCRSSVR